MSNKQKELFKTRLVPGKAGSDKLFGEEFVTDDGPMECLGMTGVSAQMYVQRGRIPPVSG